MITREEYETNKAILEGAPDGATHYTDPSVSFNIYAKVEHLSGFYLWLGGKWEEYPIYAGIKCLEQLCTICAAYEREQGQQWISVKDALPKGQSGNYLAYRPNAPINANVVTLWYDPIHNGWSSKFKVTHWMPLPKPPQEGE